MLTTIVHRIAAAGLFALMLVASSHSTARADWTVTSSCVGTWGMGTCAVNKRHFPRDPHIRQVQTVDNEREVQESLARDRKWLAFCKPSVVRDNYGVERYQYARAGCEFGRSE